MKRALVAVLWVELLAGVLWVLLAATASGAGGLAVIAAFVYVYALFAALFLFAAWVYWKYPNERRLAGWIMALPILFWFLPSMIRSMAGGPLSTQQLIGASIILLVAAVGFCWVLPRKAVATVPECLLRSRIFNWLILLAMIAGWLFFVLVLSYVVNSKSPSTSSTGEGLAYAIILAGIYLIWLGVGSLIAATWAWLSLRGGIALVPRKLNVAQLTVAAPSLLIGIVFATWFAGQ